MDDRDLRQALYDHFIHRCGPPQGAAKHAIKLAKLADAIVSYLPPYIREDFLKTADIKEIE